MYIAMVYVSQLQAVKYIILFESNGGVCAVFEWVYDRFDGDLKKYISARLSLGLPVSLQR